MNRNITQSFTQIFSKIIDLIGYCLDQLYSIKIANTNLLFIMIAITIIGVIIPVLLTIPKATKTMSERVIKK